MRFDRRNTIDGVVVLRMFGVQVMHCPFCRCPGHLYLGPMPHVTCLSCGADGPLADCEGRRDIEGAQLRAVLLWNERSGG